MGDLPAEPNLCSVSTENRVLPVIPEQAGMTKPQNQGSNKHQIDSRGSKGRLPLLRIHSLSREKNLRELDSGNEFFVENRVQMLPPTAELT